MAAKQKPAEIEWKVVTALSHGGFIHGARRAAGDVFQAPEAAMHFLELEGVIARVATKTPDAPPFAPPGHDGD